MKKLTPALMSLLMVACASEEKAGYYKGYELPPYTVQKTVDNIELRHYTPQLVAEVTVDGTRDDSVTKAFRILAAYIFGDNIAKKSVDMTTPVVQSATKIDMTTPVVQTATKIEMTTPVVQSAQGNQWVVHFGMPKNYTLQTLPQATDNRIRFRMTDEKQVVAIRFSGIANDSNLQEHQKKLEQFVAQQKLTVRAPATFAYYDSPFTLPWNRRNEVMFDIAR